MQFWRAPNDLRERYLRLVILMIVTHKLKRWHVIHKWISLICAFFLLLICLTGLPLVFRNEIDQWMAPHHYANLPCATQASVGAPHTHGRYE
jgi:hypothetical protein